MRIRKKRTVAVIVVAVLAVGLGLFSVPRLRAALTDVNVHIVDSLGNIINGTASGVTALTDTNVHAVDSTGHIIDTFGGGNLAAPGPIGGTTPSTGQFTNLGINTPPGTGDTISWPTTGGATANVVGIGHNGGDFWINGSSNVDIWAGGGGAARFGGGGSITLYFQTMIGLPSSRNGLLTLATNLSSGTFSLQTATNTTSYTLTMPTGVPAVSGQVLAATTAGVASWVSVAPLTSPTFTGNVTGSTFVGNGAPSISGGGALVGNSNSLAGQITGIAATGNVFTPGFTCPHQVFALFQDVSSPAGQTVATATTATTLTFTGTVGHAINYIATCL